MIFRINKFWLTHYENDPGEGEGEGDPGNNEPESKTFTEDQVNKIVQKRTEKARKAQQTALKRLEQLESQVKMTSEEREELQKEIEELQKQTLSSEEIAKREQKKAKEKYENDLKTATEQAESWRSRHDDLKINYEINSAASKHGVMGASVPFLESYLRPNTKLVEERNEDGEATGNFIPQVTFQDSDEDGNSIEIQMSVQDVVKRMKELPERFGQLFEPDTKSGTGTRSGEAGRGPGKDVKNLTQQEYMKLRKENPEMIYG